jgi:hypothetical protein
MKRAGPPPGTGSHQQATAKRRRKLTAEEQRRALALAITQLEQEIAQLDRQIRQLNRQIAQHHQNEQPVPDAQPERPVRRRSARRRYDRTKKPVLTFSATYGMGAVRTQKENVTQNMFFDQTATLALDANAPHSIDHYYEFRQQVKDRAAYESGEGHEEPGFVQDGPYQPPYNDKAGKAKAGQKQIQFKDEPGYSTDRKVAAGEWLTSYEVSFRWVVTAKYGDGQTWTSPEVQHSLTSPYDGGKDAAVNVQVADGEEWEVDLPPRPEEDD